MTDGHGRHEATVWPDYRLAVDFGTSNTVAVVRRSEHGVPLLFDGSPMLPSAVCVGSGGDLLTGRDAVHEALSRPSWCEPAPKRRVGEDRVVLGTEEYEVRTLVAAVLRRVRDEAVGATGHPPAELVMTHPRGWGAIRCAVLAAAAEDAGLPPPLFVSEPTAAAGIAMRAPDGDAAPPAGGTGLIYDFGGGTFEVSVVRDAGDGTPTVLASEELTTVGGIDIDDAVVEYLGGTLDERHAARWHQLLHSPEESWQRARWQLWQNVRYAKERLSRAHQVSVHVPVIDVDVDLSREAFEQLSRPIIQRTVELSRTALRHAHVRADELTGIHLVGGSSRIPLVARLLTKYLHIETVAGRQPETVVAEGAAACRPMEDRPENQPENLRENQPETPDPRRAAAKGRWATVLGLGAGAAAATAAAVLATGRDLLSAGVVGTLSGAVTVGLVVAVTALLSAHRQETVGHVPQKHRA